MTTMRNLSVAGFLCQKDQSHGFLRSHTVAWETPRSNEYYLEYSYDGRVWYALNGGNAIPASEGNVDVMQSAEIVGHKPEGISVPVGLLRDLQKKYGAPEPVCITALESLASTESGGLPDSVTVAYSNGMQEKRRVIPKDGGGMLHTPAYPAPLIRHRADPFVYKHSDGNYYFIGSHTDAGHNLDGRYQYRYLILRCAKTLEDLTDNSGRYTEKTIYERSPVAGGTMSPHLWAPEIHFIHGKWYIYYTTTISDVSSWRIRPHCLECLGNDPMSDAWIEKGPIRTTVPGDIAFTDFSLDHTYFEHNGVDYFVWAQKTNNISDLFIARLSDPWTICTPAVKISRPAYNWETHGFAVNEGPAVIRHQDRIFITFSASGTDALYCMGLLYADKDADLLVPDSWHKLPYPVFQSSENTGIYGPGHNSFTRSTDDSEDLFVYHGRQEARYLGQGDYQPLYDAGRNTYVGKVFWGPDGMPSFSVPGASITAGEGDLIIGRQKRKADSR